MYGMWGSATIVPADIPPSPHVIVAVKLLGNSLGLWALSVKTPTPPLYGIPSWAAKVIPWGSSAASQTRTATPDNHTPWPPGSWTRTRTAQRPSSTYFG